MSLADEDFIDPAAHDLARLMALEHIVTAQFFAFACIQAERHEITATEAAETFRSGVIGGMADGRVGVPAGFDALIRAKATKLMDHVVSMARTSDKLRDAD